MLIGGTARIGDAVMSLPAVTALVRSFPECRAALFAPGASEAVYRCSGLPLSVHPCPAGGLSLLRHFYRWRGQDAGTAVLLSGGFVWALGARLAGFRKRIGLDSDGRRSLLTDRVEPEQREIHQVQSYLRIAAAAGADVSGGAVPRMVLPVSAAVSLSRELPEQFLTDPYFILAPGASRAGKRWPQERFLEVGKRLVASGLRCAVLGSRGEKRLVDSLAAAVGGGALPAADLPLNTVFSLIAGARFHIGNNSGLAHVASALGVPCVCLSGPSNPDKSGPLGQAVYHLGGSDRTGREGLFRIHPALRELPASAVLDLVRSEILQ